MRASGQVHSIPFSFAPTFTWGGSSGAPWSLVLQMHQVLGAALATTSRDPVRLLLVCGSQRQHLCLQWGSWCNWRVFTQNHRIYLFTEKKNNPFSFASQRTWISVKWVGTILTRFFFSLFPRHRKSLILCSLFYIYIWIYFYTIS